MEFRIETSSAPKQKQELLVPFITTGLQIASIRSKWANKLDVENSLIYTKKENMSTTQMDVLAWAFSSDDLN